MDLYKVLLVDDEEDIRVGISRKMDWSGLGFELVGEAENGRDALELAEQQWRSASDKLDALKAQGKSRSATAQQLLAQKVTFATMLHAFGVEDA